MHNGRCTVDLWTAGCAGSRLTAQARSPMDKPWTTLRVAHNLPTGRRLPTSSTALGLIGIKSGKVKTISPVQALAYSNPVAVQATVTTAIDLAPIAFQWTRSSQLALFSDGLLEAENGVGEQFGERRLLAAIAGAQQGGRRDAVQQALAEHLGAAQAQDDVSLLLLTCPTH